MKRSIQILLLTIRHLTRAQEVAALSELPFSELLAQKKILEGGNLTESMPAPLALVGEPSEEKVSFKGFRELPRRNAFYGEDYEDEKSHVHKMKDEHKIHDILNTSIMALSYLAFGGYLLCMIVSALREKRRRILMNYPFVGSATQNNQLTQVLQHYVTQRPVRPFIRFPAVTVHQGGKKRKRRSNQRKATWEDTDEDFLTIDAVDYVESLGLDGAAENSSSVAPVAPRFPY